MLKGVIVQRYYNIQVFTYENNYALPAPIIADFPLAFPPRVDNIDLSSSLKHNGPREFEYPEPCPMH